MTRRDDWVLSKILDDVAEDEVNGGDGLGDVPLPPEPPDGEDPGEEEPQWPDPPRPIFLLAPLIGVRPPWAWFNLDQDEADLLDECLGTFVDDYNHHLVHSDFDVIPACWRKHPYLMQVLPTLFWSWQETFRAAGATSGTAALDWYHRHLRTFQERLPDALGDGGQLCRQGDHQPQMSRDAAAAVVRASGARDTVGGTQYLRSVAFGTAAGAGEGTWTWNA